MPTFTRRQFIRGLGGGAALATLPGAAARLGASLATAPAIGAAERRILVVIQLCGGNDWINTFVPLDDQAYHHSRPTLRLRGPELLPLTDRYAVNRAGAGLGTLFHEGRLTVVSDVVGAQPNLSHYRSTEEWHVGGQSDRWPRSGWLGRCFAALDGRPGGVRAFHNGRSTPRILLGETGTPPATTALASTGIGVDRVLSEIGERAGRHGGTELYFVAVPGFDTHFAQATTHPGRLRLFSDALLAMQQRLEQRGVAPRTLAVVFSEFGRTQAENRQGGTDHNPIGSVLLVGQSTRGGFHDPISPSGDRSPTTSLRRIWATVGARWLGLRPEFVFDAAITPLDVITGETVFS